LLIRLFIEIGSLIIFEIWMDIANVSHSVIYRPTTRQAPLE
jgi:hypothetical protein